MDSKTASGRGQLFAKMVPKCGPVIKFGFTWFGYNDINVKKLQKLNAEHDLVEYLIVGHELCPSTGNPHLQGFCKLTKKRNFGFIKKLLSGCGGDNVEICKCVGNTRIDEPYIHYCRKTDSADPDFKIYPHPEDNRNSDPEDHLYHYFTNGTYVKPKKGKRNDIVDVLNFIKNSEKVPTFDDVTEAFPSDNIATKHVWVEKVLTRERIKRENIEYNEFRDLEFKDFVPTKWQQYIVDDILNRHNDFITNKNIYAFNEREIVWVYDPDTGRGKSKLVKYILYICSKNNINVCHFNNGKSADIAQKWNGELINVFDLEKCVDGGMNYSALERHKNGLVTSSKYMSHTKRALVCPYLICFANFLPETEKMGPTRWKIIYLYGGDIYTMTQTEYTNATKFSVCTLNEVKELKKSVQMLKDGSSEQLEKYKSIFK